MSLLDRLGKVAEDLGSAFIAAPGVAWDTATYVIPGDQWGDADDKGGLLSWSSPGPLLNNYGQRFGDLTYGAGPKVLGKTMHGLNWIYHEGVDQPLSSAMIMASHMDAGHYGDLFSGDAWSKAYGIAEHQSFGQSTTFAVMNSKDPFDYADQTAPVLDDMGRPVEDKARVLTPFEATEGKAHPFLANASAFAMDVGVSWYLDPAALALKGAGEARQVALGRVPEAARPDFMTKLDGSLEAGKGLKRDWSGRFDDYLAYINGDNAAGKALNAAEIRAITPELQKSAAGRAISSALEDALKIPDVTQRENAARRVFAVGVGDTSQISRLETEIAGTKAIADKLKNVAAQQTVKLTEEALDVARKTSPEFRAAFNAQIANLDEADDVTKFVGDWHKQVSTKLSGQTLLRSEGAGRLDHLPGVHKVPLPGSTAARLRKTQGEGALDKVEQAHDSLVNRLTRFPKNESFSSVYQQGLHSVPLMVAYPARWIAATSPTKALPMFARNLSQTHFTGVIETHNWDGAVDQLDSMMKIAGVDNTTRLAELSRAMKVGNEMDKVRAAARVEAVAKVSLMRAASAKHGINIDEDFVKEALLAGQAKRDSSVAALSGGRAYASTAQPAEMADRTRGMIAARGAAQRDGMRVAELGENFVPRMDHWIDESGVPVALPVVSSQLANRIPLVDVNMVKQATDDAAWAKRFAEQGEMWKAEATELRDLRAAAARATGKTAERISRAIYQKRQTMDAILHAASVGNRWWKTSVLFRLGYPMRVIADDHMRIAARMGYLPFLGSNLPEAVSNSFYNYLPGGKGTRAGNARRDYELLKVERNRLRHAYGRKTPASDAEWAELKGLRETILNGVSTPEEKALAHTRLLALDPDGKTLEFDDLSRQIVSAQRSIATHQRNIAKWREAGDSEQKVAAAHAQILDRQGVIDQVSAQLAGRINPEEARTALLHASEALKEGPKGFRGDKRRIGTKNVKLGDGNEARGSLTIQGYRDAVGSNENYKYLLTDGEATGFNMFSSGHWRTVSPGTPGYYQLWANVLNHQFQHSSEFMSIVKGGVRTPQEFAAWVRRPENSNLIDRMQPYAHDAEDWGARLIGITDEYIPSDELLELVSKGRVTARQLKRLHPEGDTRLPQLHGQLADVQSGRSTVTRAFSEAVGRAFSYLSEVPTDRLSRHPYFNAVYKREVRAAYESRIVGKGGRFTQADLSEVEDIARSKALAELKNTLWDISAHSHAAHTMRFLSPFFAAHQEALTRWWGLAKDDPSIVRKFQLFFDAPRKAGLTYNDDTGELVKPGDGIGSAGNRIMIQLPFAGENNAVNKWLNKVGGGKPWSISENGLNLILQNGIANPGVGPVVTIPIETLVQRYPEAVEFGKAARVLNQYPPTGDDPAGIAVGALTPAWAKRAWAYYRGPESEEFARYYMQNFSDGLVNFRLLNERPPDQQELDDLQDRANKETHMDLVLMGLSNIAGLTPAKPNSKYAVVQNGLSRLYDQKRAEGHDMDWLRSKFKAMYGEAYMAMIYSMGTNPGDLEGSVAEVSGIKNHRTLMRHIDPSLTRMVIGPEVDQADKAEQLYSSAAASWLSSQETGDPGVSYRGRKDPREAATALVVSQGWNQYDELLNALDAAADKQGLSGYEASPQLVQIKRDGLKFIKESNPVFASAYDSYGRESYDKLLSDMRQIVSNPRLANDPGRSDIFWLNQYLGLRDMITGQLKERTAAGGDSTIGAQANRDLATAFAAGLSYINQHSMWFKQYSYHGVIENDPLLVDSIEPELASAG